MVTLPMKSVVLFIAVGTLVFVIVFIFAKRQIARFALKGRGPHKPIGADAPKSMRTEIERLLKRSMEIHYEPKMLTENVEAKCAAMPTGETMQFYYRMKAVDSLKLLDQEFCKYSPNIKRKYRSNLRAFLLEHRQNGPLQGVQLEVVEKYCDAYDHARHEAKDFGIKEYQQYMDNLNKLILVLREKTAEKNNRNETVGEAPEEQQTSIPNGASTVTEGVKQMQMIYRPKAGYRGKKPQSEAEASLLEGASLGGSSDDITANAKCPGVPV